MKRSLFVYFIKPVGRDGPIKIGCSQCPPQRLKDFTIWSPDPLEIIGTVPGNLKDERFLHDCFASQHSHFEWFHSSPEMMDAITRIIDAGAVSVMRGVIFRVGSIRSKRRRLSPEQRLYISYMHRLRHARKRLWGLGDRRTEPARVHAIMARWCGGFDRDAKQPSPADIAYLDRYLANPLMRSVADPIFVLRDAA